MTKPTSAETYRQIKDEGLLSELRFRVYDIIYRHQPITISQMVRRAASTVTNTGSFTGRISELERMGVIYADYQGPCPVTGRKVIFWKTTNGLPKKPPKKITNAQKIVVYKKVIKLMWNYVPPLARKKAREMLLEIKD